MDIFGPDIGLETYADSPTSPQNLKSFSPRAVDGNLDRDIGIETHWAPSENHLFQSDEQNVLNEI